MLSFINADTVWDLKQGPICVIVNGESVRPVSTLTVCLGSMEFQGSRNQVRGPYTLERQYRQ